MATLKLTFRSQKDNINTVTLRARYSINRQTILYAMTETVVNPQYWNEKTQRLNYIDKPKAKDLAGLSIDEQNEKMQHVNNINIDIAMEKTIKMTP